MKKFIFGTVFPIVLGVCLALLIKTYIFEVNKVVGESMVPTFQDNDYILTEKVSYRFGKPNVNDIVVVKVKDIDNTEKVIIKRVIGLPNDKIEITPDGVFRNGKKVEEKYILEKMDIYENIEFTVGKEEIFVMGDNRNNSADSRIYGNIPFNNVKGKVFFEVADDFFKTY